VFVQLKGAFLAIYRCKLEFVTQSSINLMNWCIVLMNTEQTNATYQTGSWIPRLILFSWTSRDIHIKHSMKCHHGSLLVWSDQRIDLFTFGPYFMWIRVIYFYWDWTPLKAFWWLAYLSSERGIWMWILVKPWMFVYEILPKNVRNFFYMMKNLCTTQYSNPDSLE
jgi:hypothetical protein